MRNQNPAYRVVEASGVGLNTPALSPELLACSGIFVVANQSCSRNFHNYPDHVTVIRLI